MPRFGVQPREYDQMLSQIATAQRGLSPDQMTLAQGYADAAIDLPAVPETAPAGAGGGDNVAMYLEPLMQLIQSRMGSQEAALGRKHQESLLKLGQAGQESLVEAEAAAQGAHYDRTQGRGTPAYKAVEAETALKTAKLGAMKEAMGYQKGTEGLAPIEAAWQNIQPLLGQRSETSPLDVIPAIRRLHNMMVHFGQEHAAPAALGDIIQKISRMDVDEAVKEEAIRQVQTLGEVQLPPAGAEPGAAAGQTPKWLSTQIMEDPNRLPITKLPLAAGAAAGGLAKGLYKGMFVPEVKRKP